MNLQKNVASAVYSSLVKTVIKGESTGDAIKAIEKQLKTQTRYIKTWYETSRQLYEQKIEDLSAQHYKEDFGGDIFWEYIGAPLDEKTRQECEKALRHRVFTDAEKIAFDTGEMYDAGVPRWRCRHIFWEITKRRYRELAGLPMLEIA